MRIVVTVILLISIVEAGAQRISSSLGINIPGAFGMIRFDQNVYSPANNHAVYFVNPPDAKSERYTRYSVFGMGKYYHHIGIGVNYQMKIDFKRFAFRIGYQLMFDGVSVELNQFGWSSSIIDEYPAVFKYLSFHHRYPISLSIDLKKKTDSPFLYFGAEPGFVFARIESMDWETDLFYDRVDIPFLYGIYYDRNLYLNLFAGTGFRWKRFEWTIQYKQRMRNKQSGLTMHPSSIDLGMNIQLSYKSFKRSKFIYQEE